ncbi:MAG: hypothetical protein V8T29_07810 [Oscillospiraceae bacterium]|nr:putative uncharacterized protein [Firmicutes bacterium CAG:137]
MARKLNLRVSDAECKLLLHSLVELRNALIREGRYTDFVDEVILKVADASLKRGKTV